MKVGPLKCHEWKDWNDQETLFHHFSYEEDGMKTCARAREKETSHERYGVWTRMRHLTVHFDLILAIKSPLYMHHNYLVPFRKSMIYSRVDQTKSGGKKYSSNAIETD